MKCSICDSSYKVGKDNLCIKCRRIINLAKKLPTDDDAYDKMVSESQYDIRYGIDTFIADSYNKVED